MKAAYLVLGVLLAAGGLLLGVAELLAPCANPLDPLVREVATCQETRTLTLVGFGGMVLGVVLFLSGRSRRLETAPYLRSTRSVTTTPDSDARISLEAQLSAPRPRFCPACGGRYAPSMTFCPMDGATLTDSI